MITVYTKNDCGYCMMAKAFLKNNDIDFKEVNVSEDTASAEFLKEQGHRTVPQIYYNNELLVEGGAQALVALGPEGVKEKLNENSVDVSKLGSI